MYAVIETGGKQYRVEVGTELEVELLDVEPGQSIVLDRVLLVADGAEAAVGTPVVDGAAVEAEVVGGVRGDKVVAFKYRPKARRRVMKGHRQGLTLLRIADIRFGGRSAAEARARAQDDAAAERRTVEEAAARQAAEDAALAAKLKLATEAAQADEGAGATAAIEDVGATAADQAAGTKSRRGRAKATAEIPEAGQAAAKAGEVAEEAPARPARTRAVKAAAEVAVPEEADPATPAHGEAEAEAAAAGDASAAESSETTDVAPRKRTRTRKDD